MIAILVVVLGGLGLRLLGFAYLAVRTRRGDRGPRLLLLVSCVSLILGFAVVGRPVRLDGIQFAFVAHPILWIAAAVALAAASRETATTRAFAGVILLIAIQGPVRYLLKKAAPEVWTSSSGFDNLRLSLGPTTMAACRWLRTNSTVTDRLALPLVGDPENRGGFKPLFVSLLAERRIVADSIPFSVSDEVARERQAAVNALFVTADRAEGERLLSVLQAQWIWEDAARPLKFESFRLVPRARFGSTRLVQILP
jgi:hypothetical protein